MTTSLGCQPAGGEAPEGGGSDCEPSRCAEVGRARTREMRHGGSAPASVSRQVWDPRRGGLAEFARRDALGSGRRTIESGARTAPRAVRRPLSCVALDATHAATRAPIRNGRDPVADRSAPRPAIVSASAVPVARAASAASRLGRACPREVRHGASRALPRANPSSAIHSTVDSLPAPTASFLMRRRASPRGTNPGFVN